jgi:hypothetical protein
MIGSNTILAGHGSTRQVRGATSAKWYPAFVDPNSIGMIDADAVIIYGAAPCTLRVGPPGAWFYPPTN